MLELFIVGYSLYFLVVICTSVLQIKYVKLAKDKKAVILESDKYKEAADYSMEKEKISVVSHFYEFAIFFIWIFFGLEYLNNMITLDNSLLKAVLFIDIFIIVNWIFGLPFELYSTFKLDKKYGFSNMTPALYIKDTLKTGILFLVCGSAVIAGIAFIVESFETWWIWGFVFIFAILILINMLYPVIRDKMYDKFEPLKDKELEEKIESLLKAVDFKSSGVFQIDASKRDNRLNAYFGGLGSTKRVVLFDTLIDKLNHDELLAVLGHELGHFKNGDILKNIGIMGVVLFVFFAIFGNLSDSIFSGLNLNNEPYAIIVLFLMFSPILSFFLMPLISAISRHNEYAADEFGSNLSSKENLVSALLKLANENKSFPLSHPIYIFFYYSHPPLVERFKELGYDIEDGSLDYYDITIDDAIANTDRTIILNRCHEVAASEFDAECGGLVIRDGKSGAALAVNSSTNNENTIETSGFDLEASYETDIGGGALFTGLSLNYLDNYSITGIETGDVSDLTGELLFPDFTFNLNTSYTIDDINIYWQLRYRAETVLKNDNTADSAELNSADAIIYNDLRVSYSILEESSVYVGINNVFDEQPKLIGANQKYHNVGTNSNGIAYDLTGRQLYAGIIVKF